VQRSWPWEIMGNREIGAILSTFEKFSTMNFSKVDKMAPISPFFHFSVANFSAQRSTSGPHYVRRGHLALVRGTRRQRMVQEYLAHKKAPPRTGVPRS
jgi:hypothetical protein